MIDTHCHLDYCEDPVAARDPSLTAIISIGTTVERSKRTLELAEQFANVWAVVGIHPNDATDARDATVRQEIEALARHPKVVGIGETGFDTYWERVPLEVQRDSFHWQADLAQSLDKPLILHVRDKQNQEVSVKEAVNALREARHTRGILHCFNGHDELLEAGLELGWMVSFAGNLTYKKAQVLHDAARKVPQDRLLVETDSPFLTPEPHRGQRNVPANVRLTAAFLAQLRGEPLELVEAYTDVNAKGVYRLS